MAATRIAGTGSAIADYLFTGIDFNGPAFRKYVSRRPGDGGLEPGKLVLTEDFEAFTGKPALEALRELVGDRSPDSFNLGGPAPVALINAAQLLGDDAAVRFHSAAGSDEAGDRLRSILEKTPVRTERYRTADGSSPFTYVLSDPAYHGGAGERTFVNNIGAAWSVVPDDLDESFYAADIVLFGGTALVPRIHESLTDLLARATRRGCVTVVTTVYDFPNQKRDPHAPWPLGRGDESYPLIDLLIADREEAVRLSGRSDVGDAFDALAEKGVSAVVVTNGKKPVMLSSNGRLFAPLRMSLPVSHAVEDARKAGPVRGDTTGCGDNFAGGVIASMAAQLRGGAAPDLREAVAWGICSGDFACFSIGGTYIEGRPGEKRERIEAIYRGYVAENRDLLGRTAS